MGSENDRSDPPSTTTVPNDVSPRIDSTSGFASTGATSTLASGQSKSKLHAAARHLSSPHLCALGGEEPQSVGGQITPEREESVDGINLPGPAEWLEYWQRTEVPQDRTFIAFAEHLHERQSLRRSNSSPDLL